MHNQMAISPDALAARRRWSDPNPFPPSPDQRTRKGRLSATACFASRKPGFPALAPEEVTTLRRDSRHFIGAGRPELSTQVSMEQRT